MKTAQRRRLAGTFVVCQGAIQNRFLISCVGGLAAICRNRSYRVTEESASSINHLTTMAWKRRHTPVNRQFITSRNYLSLQFLIVLENARTLSAGPTLPGSANAMEASNGEPTAETAN